MRVERTEWNDERVALLQDCIMRDMKGRDMAELLGVTPHALYNKMSRLGWTLFGKPSRESRFGIGAHVARHCPTRHTINDMWDPNSPRCRPTVPRVRCLANVESDKWAMR